MHNLACSDVGCHLTVGLRGPWPGHRHRSPCAVISPVETCNAIGEREAQRICLPWPPSPAALPEVVLGSCSCSTHTSGFMPRTDVLVQLLSFGSTLRCTLVIQCCYCSLLHGLILLLFGQGDMQQVAYKCPAYLFMSDLPGACSAVRVSWRGGGMLLRTLGMQQESEGF